MKVADLMQIPDADGLFHKALIMSGVGSKSLMPNCTGDGREIVTAMLQELGLKVKEVEKLETVPYYELVKAYEKVRPAIAAKGGYVGGNPLVNDYYKGSPLEYGLRDRARSIPLMIGSVFGEFSFVPARFDKNSLSAEETHEILEKVYGEHTDEIIRAFNAAYPGKAVTDVLSVDRVMRQPTKTLAAMHAENGDGQTFLYNFILEFPFQYQKAAWHCSDIPFFFCNTDKVEVCTIPGVTEKLERQMFGALMSFARTGKPSCAELPEWESVTPEKEPTMIFGRTCELRCNYDDGLYEAIDRVLPPFNLMKAMAEQNVQH